jgi:hypothetical protein
VYIVVDTEHDAEESLCNVRTPHSGGGGDVATILVQIDAGPHGTAQSCEHLTVDIDDFH